jgi:hypothetical protein
MHQRKLGRPVRASTVAAIVLALLVAGCGGGTAKPAAAAATHPTTNIPTSTPTPTPTPTKTGPGPMTAAELAWLTSVNRMHAKINAINGQSVHLTRTEMLSLSNLFGECRRVLRQIGPATARLRPVQTLVNKACTTFDRGATCLATAAQVSNADGEVIAGSPEEQTQKQSIDCSVRAYDDGSTTLSQAQTKAEEIQIAAS